jgi:hypothetical protein
MSQKIGAILEWATFHNVGCRTIAAFIAVRRKWRYRFSYMTLII